MSDNCQVFTPASVVDEMIKKIGYIENIHDKKVLENSCGNGNFLVEIVENLIKDAIKNKKDKHYIKNALEKNIIAFELDKNRINECILRLNKVSKKYNLDKINWNIINEDFLKYKLDIEFDFIIGNPPYISYRNLKQENRTYIKKKFKSCEKGKPDYYYAFIEKSQNLLNKNGKLIYIVPNNFFKNEFEVI